jgi:putative hydrolase of the HAD superfamily
MTAPLKAIAFDLWETLITDTPEMSRAQTRLRLDRMERILIESGYPQTAERIEHAHQQMWHRCHELYWSADRDIDCRVQIEHFLEELDLDPAGMPLDALEDAYARAAVAIPPRLVDGADEVLRELDQRGFALGLISNTGRTPGYALREILQLAGVASLFDAMVFSNEHGACKPQPSIFETLREGLGVDFGEMMFVGDNLYVDVHGAQRCGMRAVHFIPEKRGTAVAPPVDHGLEITPDATIRDLRELLTVVDRRSRRFLAMRTFRT